jgi:hypothetical protein
MRLSDWSLYAAGAHRSKMMREPFFTYDVKDQADSPEGRPQVQVLHTENSRQAVGRWFSTIDDYRNGGRSVRPRCRPAGLTLSRSEGQLSV